MSVRGHLSESELYTKLFVPPLEELPVRPPPEHLPPNLDRSTIASIFLRRTGLTLQSWQLDAVHSRLLGQHVVAVQPCGSGKTAIFVAPIVVLDELAKASGSPGGTGRIALVVCPRDAIEEQVVCLFLFISGNTV